MLKTQQGKGLLSQILKSNFYQIGRTQKIVEVPRHALQSVSHSNNDFQFLQQFSTKNNIINVKEWELQWKNQLFSHKNDNNLDRITSLTSDPRIPSMLGMNAQVNNGPSTLQSILIPKFLSNTDAIVESGPFSGKTLAYSLSVLIKTLNEKNAMHLGERSAGINSSKHIKVTQQLAVRSLILTSSHQQAAHIQSVMNSLAEGQKLNIVSLSHESEEDNYNAIMVPQRNIDILIATPTDIRNAIKKKWISTTKVNTLVIDDASLFIQSQNGNFKTLVQVLRSLPNASYRQTIVLGDYISDAMAEAIRPYLKVFNDELILFKGQNNYFNSVDFQFVETNKNNRLSLLKEALENNDKTVIFANHPEEIANALSDQKVVNLSVSRSQLKAQLQENPNYLKDATIFVTNDEYGIGQHLIPSLSHVVHYDMDSLGHVLARLSSIFPHSQSPLKSVTLYDASSEAEAVSHFGPFLQSLNLKTPTLPNASTNEAELLREAEQIGDRELLEEILPNNYRLENLYAKNYGSEYLQHLRATNPSSDPKPESWEWRNETIFFHNEREKQAKQLIDLLSEAREKNIERRAYKKMKQQKMKEAYLKKKQKRKERKAEEEEEDE